LFTGDYLRDTRHLSPLKHGIYLLLLMHCWDQKGPVPLDEQEAAGIANCRSTDEIDALRYVLDRYFTRMIDGFYNHRMQQEVERSESISHARSEAGRKGYEARAKHLSGKSQAIAKQVHLSPSPSPSLSPSLSPTPEKQSLGVTSAEKQARATRLALLSCPEDWVLWCKANRPDLDPVQTWDRFSDYWKAVPGAKGRKLDWPATWRNWVRNERAGKGSSVDVAELVAELEREGK
jgi:uncharacterized protein YdaU (DUF1376 family)